MSHLWFNPITGKFDLVNDASSEGKVAISVNDTTPDYLDSKITTSLGISKIILSPGADETLWLFTVPGEIDHDQLLNYVANEHIDWTAASAGTIDPTNYVDNDENVKVSSNDTTPGDLSTKLVAGTNITLTENNDGANETLTIDASGGGGASVTEYVNQAAFPTADGTNGFAWDQSTDTLFYDDGAWEQVVPDQDLTDYVQGPASSTDNRTAYFDGTTGKLIQQLSTNSYGDTTGRQYNYAFRALNNGSATAPAFSRSTDTNTGMYFVSSDALGFSAAGSNIGTIRSTGLGIFSTSPSASLDVKAKLPTDEITWKSITTPTGTYRTWVYELQDNEPITSATAVDTTQTITIPTNSSFSVRYWVVVRRPSIDGINTYEGVVSGYVSAKGIHTIANDSQNTTYEGITAAASFTMAPNGKTTAIVGRPSNGVKTTLHWSFVYETHVNQQV